MKNSMLMIVNRVFNKGEGGRIISNARWLGLWSNESGESSADTATLRQIDNNIIVWIWQATKLAGKFSLYPIHEKRI